MATPPHAHLKPVNGANGATASLSASVTPPARPELSPDDRADHWSATACFCFFIPLKSSPTTIQCSISLLYAFFHLLAAAAEVDEMAAALAADGKAGLSQINHNVINA